MLLILGVNMKGVARLVGGLTSPVKKGQFCKQHKTEGMVSVVVSGTCSEKNCGVAASFGMIDGGHRFCLRHKTDDMVNVVTRQCEHEGCTSGSRIFDVEGGKGRFCASHKTAGMVDVKSKRCEHQGCTSTSRCFNVPGEKGLFCANHKTDGMVNVTSVLCPGQGGMCSMMGTKKYKGYCTFCFSHTFPKDPLTFQIRSKTKEIAVRDYINVNFEGFSHDQPLYTPNCDCTIRRRIDHRRQIGNTIVAIETDERQHKSYDEVDENARYNDVYMGFSGKWVFIRFNPDGYRDGSGKKRNPCMATRLRSLGDEISKQIQRAEDDLVTGPIDVIHLFYDEV